MTRPDILDPIVDRGPALRERSARAVRRSREGGEDAPGAAGEEDEPLSLLGHAVVREVEDFVPHAVACGGELADEAVEVIAMVGQ